MSATIGGIAATAAAAATRDRTRRVSKQERQREGYEHRESVPVADRPAQAVDDGWQLASCAVVGAKPVNRRPQSATSAIATIARAIPSRTLRLGLTRDRERHEEESPGVERHFGGLQIRGVRVGRPLR